jgi:hypothetical protein
VLTSDGVGEDAKRFKLESLKLEWLERRGEEGNMMASRMAMLYDGMS